MEAELCSCRDVVSYAHYIPTKEIVFNKYTIPIHADRMALET